MNCCLGFVGWIEEVDLSVPNLAPDIHGVSVAQGIQQVVKAEWVAQIEKRVVNLQYPIDLDDRHRVSQTFREAEFIATGVCRYTLLRSLLTRCETSFNSNALPRISSKFAVEASRNAQYDPVGFEIGATAEQYRRHAT